MATSFDYEVRHDEGLVLFTPPAPAPTVSLSWVDAMELSTKLRLASDQAHAYETMPRRSEDTPGL